jgi:hypothetical protein
MEALSERPANRKAGVVLIKPGQVLSSRSAAFTGLGAKGSRD